mgnify:CR=1 FL=1
MKNIKGKELCGDCRYREGDRCQYTQSCRYYNKIDKPSLLAAIGAGIWAGIKLLFWPGRMR